VGKIGHSIFALERLVWHGDKNSACPEIRRIKLNLNKLQGFQGSFRSFVLETGFRQLPGKKESKAISPDFSDCLLIF
jgi:hypothetical protein